ncbi:MAG: hypothetical protein HON90_16525 [Halobacteriovoraceae bacterium]|jgi:hypothetical protein|nr:hypothetical protein [Halobacteriovoraceae bacterium]
MAIKNIMILSGLIFLTVSEYAYSKARYPKIYPFIPFKVSDIYNSVENLSEDKDFVFNFIDINSMNLSKAKTKLKPWTSSYWPLNRGLIADPYKNTVRGYYLSTKFLSWSRNFNVYSRRKKGVFKNVDKLTEGQLATMAPSEKYDILLGDKTFDLTSRLWDYTQKWGNKKEFGFLSKLSLVGEDALSIAKEMVGFGWYESVDDAFADAYQLRGSLAVDEANRLVKEGQFSSVESAMPMAIQNAIADSKNYVLEKKNNLIALWEGICHGWSTAAGIVPRPRKTVKIELPDGRKLTFYPEDIKALTSLLWANSLIQDNKYLDSNTGKNIGGGVISEGLRCNLENPRLDKWGRFYDNKPDPFNKDHSPRCVGVHPAIWHLGLVNLIGKQGRSFVVEQKIGSEVDNHPMYAYKMSYFNPRTGNFSKSLENNIIQIDQYDQFKKFRSPRAKYIVGVETEMTYLDWVRPKRRKTNNERNDVEVKKSMMYDLELDENYDIVGGQWRALITGLDIFSDFAGDNDSVEEKNHNQPDFFWVITKDWKPFFNELTDIETWGDTTKAPPLSWKKRAFGAHSFIYHQKYVFSTGQKCKIIHKRTGKTREVSCEYELPKPQPLVNVVNKLIELAQ